MTVESTISRADAEIGNGRLWRAREILGSSIVTYGYSREIFYALAKVLLEMGEDLEAGKYLLLSVDTPSDTELCAINVFLSRCNDRNFQALLAKFPKVARLRERDAYPEYLRKHLTKINAPQTIATQDIASSTNFSPLYDRLLLGGCSLVAFTVIACITVGAYTILSWYWNTQ